MALDQDFSVTRGSSPRLPSITYPGGRTPPLGETHPQGVSLANEKRRGRNRRQAKIAAVSATTARAMGVCQFMKCGFRGRAVATIALVRLPGKARFGGCASEAHLETAPPGTAGVLARCFPPQARATGDLRPLRNLSTEPQRTQSHGRGIALSRWNSSSLAFSGVNRLAPRSPRTCGPAFAITLCKV